MGALTAYDSRPEIIATEGPLKPALVANEPAFIRADLHSIAANQDYLQLPRMFSTALVSASISASTPSQWPMTRLTLVADQIGPLHAIRCRHLGCLDVGECPRYAPGLRQQFDLGGRVVLDAPQCSMMSGSPVGFGQARISTSSVVPVPVPVAIIKTSWTPAPIKSAFGRFICAHGNISCFYVINIRRSCLNPSSKSGGASRMSASTIFQIRSMWSSCSMFGKRLMFLARQQLVRVNYLGRRPR
ncbi:hypothetical protein [Duganella violaceipulchra]|uniref:Uncharacterized protein n=1 Tax=Duganella violaceipulchra TaxID=2849652 RepID=A0AA41HBH2_9BURK|nr:hypothetical protein [Duganella violaceicalia]MBV6325458.1 hypothetical protein [Duganella violaceicalia]MCP2012641.1 hypothetical protein [Duganella violaceicalia]